MGREAIPHCTVGVVDNDACALENIVSILKTMDIASARLDVWSTTSPSFAIQKHRLEPNRTDIMFMDMSLGGVLGSDVARQIKKISSQTICIGITAYNVESYDAVCVKSGIAALLDKSTLRVDMPCVIADVLEGKISTRSDEGEKEILDSLPHITKTELRIIELSFGKNNVLQIADKLNMTAGTVYSHRRNIKNKFRTHEWHEVLAYCMKWHVV